MVVALGAGPNVTEGKPCKENYQTQEGIPLSGFPIVPLEVFLVGESLGNM